MINITKEAKQYFKNIILEKKAEGIFLKIINNGCSGKSYFLDYHYDKKPLNENKFFLSNDIKIKVNKKDIIYLNNIKIDLLKTNFEEKIVFSNPNILEKCGCGESFLAIDQKK